MALRRTVVNGLESNASVYGIERDDISSIELIIGELLANVYHYAPGSASLSIIADGTVPS